MNFTRQYTLPLPAEQIWPHLQDPQMLGRILPNCTRLVQTADNEFSGQLTIPIGPAQGSYEGRLTLSNINGMGYDLEMMGSGNHSFIHAIGRLQLQAQDGETAVQFTAQAKVGGRLAGFSDRLLTTTANALLRHGFEALETELLPQSDATAVTPPHTIAHQPTRHTIPIIVGFASLISLLSLATLFLGLRQLYRWWLNRLTQRIIADLRMSNEQ